MGSEWVMGALCVRAGAVVGPWRVGGHAGTPAQPPPRAATQRALQLPLSGAALLCLSLLPFFGLTRFLFCVLSHGQASPVHAR